MNVCLYGPRGSFFALREGAIPDASRRPDDVGIGRSSMEWRDGALVADFDERTTPFGAPLRGRVTLHPETGSGARVLLDPGGAHEWWPSCPAGRLEARFTHPDITFGGRGYHDANAGRVPLESSFTSWSWSRATAPDRGATVTYDVTLRSGERASHAFCFDAERGIHASPELEERALPRTGWRMGRSVRVPRGSSIAELRTLEDTPFYARSRLRTLSSSGASTVIHEELSLDRLRQAWVRFLIGFRARSR